MYHSLQFRPLILISSKLRTNSSSSIAAAPPTSSAEAIRHRMFRSLARYTFRMGVHSGDQSLCVRRGGGSSYCCSSSTRSSKMTFLLLGLVSTLPFFRVSPSLPVQKIVAPLNVMEILCNRPPLGNSMFSILCLYALPRVHRIITGRNFNSKSALNIELI